MNRESLIKEFEKKTGVKPITEAPETLKSFNECRIEYLDAFSDWLFSKVIAQGPELQEKYDKLKEEKEEESKRAWDNFHRSEIDRKALMSLQEKYDKRWRMLNEAQTVWVARDGAEAPQTPNFPTGQVTIFENKPQRWAHGTEEWQAVDGNVFFEIKPDLGVYLFPELKWEDEPLEIRLLTPEEMDGK